MQLPPTRIKSISEFHRLADLPKPEHPLITVIDLETLKRPLEEGTFSRVFDFYSIALKKNFHLKMQYGQQPHDFEEGILHFMSPGQVLTVSIDNSLPHNPSGWMIFFHPDFLWNTSLAKTIKQYDYFGYAANEALHLSDKEETILTGIAKNISQEYHGNIDGFSQPVIIAQLELLFTYADRFYQRQFVTRKVSSHALLSRLEEVLDHYFQSGALATQGLPTVSFIAKSLHVSPNYLSGLLKAQTGQNTQQLLHDKLIALAKEKLSTTQLPVGDIAYALGFEHLASFSKLFKTKTSLTPLAFRKSFQ
ncbi:Helix-turn-helix domain-containing protein [Chitinophaga costaii]|uniref:Helix-turn-helix domain-containing protein n=1 Tax=Chitinophaga costaii TaxID=1335309 RepID=A0A1C3YPB7_9BACT|nr:helix-turn-helix transcriptional regulator [Chitinophaga costaii]PUZ30037.1 AraC family transcriptional regulator [Chitinophaga costaii]SCB71934.1 Helix-turn-helix domain-containing protein [Chitinophaga costaii]